MHPKVRICLSGTGGKQGIFYALLATSCLSISPVVVKAALAEGIHPIALLTLRMVVGAAVLWGLFPILYSRALRIDMKGFLACCIAAGANALSFIAYYFALTRVNASLADVIFSLYPAFALLLLAVAGERVDAITLIRLLLGLGGVYLLLGPEGSSESIGMILVMMTAFFYALHLNLIQWCLSQYDPRTISLYVVSIIAMILIPLYLWRFRGWQPLSLSGWTVEMVTGFVSTSCARLTMFSAI